MALKLYPLGLPLDFSRDRWIAECERIDAHDHLPFFRDEQRAFLDSCRDLLAKQLAAHPTSTSTQHRVHQTV